MTLQINPFTATGLKYSKKYYATKLKYQVLTGYQIPKKDLERVRAFIKPLVNGDEAYKAVVEYAKKLDSDVLCGEWTWVSPTPRIGILLFRGIEVALFFKRQVSELAPGLGEKPPEGEIKDPDDVWQRLDLLGPSAKKANLVLTQYHTNLEQQNTLLQEQLESANKKLEDVTAKLNKYHLKEERIKELAAEKKQKERDKLKPKKKKGQLDRLCSICKCYENVHDFDKKGNCLGCTGGKAKCKGCKFRPKKTRKKKEAV